MMDFLSVSQTDFTYTARPPTCRLASPLTSGNFSYTAVRRAATEIRQGQIISARELDGRRRNFRSVIFLYTYAQNGPKMHWGSISIQRSLDRRS
jgi:hypothetical protein